MRVRVSPNPHPFSTQALYKRSGKLKRSSAAIAPLLEAAREELQYLEQMEVRVTVELYKATLRWRLP